MARLLAPLALAVGLAACQSQDEDDPSLLTAPETPEEEAITDAETPTPTPAATESPEPVSILRPGIAPPETPEVPLEPLEVTVGFPEGGAKLDEAAIAALEGVLASEQIESDAPIVLRAHSDSGGTDKSNLKASEKRGQAVRDWLVEQGIDPERITVIAFGEQNPVAPNALPDGTPNPKGRAANRRVEVSVVPVPDAPVPNESPANAADVSPES